MNNSWQNTFNELQTYISTNPDIVIKRDSTTIPENRRPEFYSLFDKVRQEIVQAEFGELLDRAETLSANYLAVEQTICKKCVSAGTLQRKQIDQIKKTLSSPFNRLRDKLGFGGFKFDEITLDDDLRLFLSDPPKALSKVLFESLFALLQGKIEADAFKDIIKEKLPVAFRQLYHSGYEKWVILSLLKSLGIKASYNSGSRILRSREILKDIRANTESQVEPPVIKKTCVLNFKSGWRIHALCTVDVIIKQAKTEQYLGIKSGFVRGVCGVNSESEIRTSVPFESVTQVQKDAPLLIYMSNNPREVSLVADKKRFWQPDMVIQCREDAGLWTKEETKRTTLLHDSLKPVIGTFVLLGPFAAENEKQEQEPDISTLNIGFNLASLAPVISHLLQGA